MWNKFNQHITLYTAILILLHAIIPHYHHSIDSTVVGECSIDHDGKNKNAHIPDVSEDSNNHPHHHGLHIDHEFDIAECQVMKIDFVEIDNSFVQFYQSYYFVFQQASIKNSDISHNNYIDETYFPAFQVKSIPLRGPPAYI